MKRVFTFVAILLAVFIFLQFFRGIEKSVRLNNQRFKEQINAVKMLESSAGMNYTKKEELSFEESEAGLVAVIQRFKQECCKLNVTRAGFSVHENGNSNAELEIPPILQKTIDYMVESDDAHISDALDKLILTGSLNESFLAARIAAQRNSINSFDAVWNRISAKKGTPVNLKNRLCEVSSEFPSAYTGPFLAEQLKSNDWQIREAACQVLAKNPAKEAVDSLCSLLGTTSMAERECVVDALIVCGSEVVPRLIEIAGGKNSNERDAALIALSRIPDPVALKYVFDAGLCKDKLRCNRSMWDTIDKYRRVILNGGDGHSKCLEEDAGVLLNAAFVVLRKQLDSSEEVIRCAAVELIGRIPSPEAMECIKKVVDTDGSLKVKAAAMKQFEYSNDPAALENAFVNIVSSDDKLRSAASRVIARRINVDMIDRLLPALNHADADVRCTAVWLIGKIDCERTRKLLIGYVGDPSSEVVHRAAYQLSRRKCYDSDVTWLKTLSKNNDIVCRNYAAEMLGEIGNQEATALLVAMLDLQKPGKAVEILGDSNDPSVFWPLFNYFVAKKRNARSLTDIMYREAHNHWNKLLPMLNSGDKVCRELAVSLLEKSEQPSVRSILRKQVLSLDKIAVEFGSAGFVQRSDIAVISNLVNELKTDGKSAYVLAFKYWESENEELRIAARNWLTSNGYIIIQVPVPVKKR